MTRPFSNILITAGPTRERLDSMRFITNYSTGRMGYELARVAVKRGYKVTLISGPTGLTPPKGAKHIETESALDMEKALKSYFKKSDCLFMTSAVCDWRPQKMVRGKIKRRRRSLMLKLVQNPDMLKGCGKNKDGKLLIGFALESEGIVKNATDKLNNKNLDLIVANRLEKAKPPFGDGKTDVVVIDRKGGKERLFNFTKEGIAERLLDRAERLWAEKH